MKKLIIILVWVILTGFIFLAIEGNDMKEIRTEIEIAAPPTKVWSILTDIDKWQEWSPVINKSKGTATLGSKLDITMCGKEKGTDGPRYYPKITKLDKDKLLQWSAKMMAGFIMTNGKILKLEETSTGTKLIHKETFSGMMVPMMWSHMEKGVPPMLNSMNEALKEYAEK
ncbi:MAG: SRPBCC domain-containing protein [Bdellovibrionaceae bacterium]|jgi:hypothetical protein|nr:SRPBCC domain-containing protein [Pseudobdellovibrionaceae bacterium]